MMRCRRSISRACASRSSRRMRARVSLALSITSPRSSMHRAISSIKLRGPRCGRPRRSRGGTDRPGGPAFAAGARAVRVLRMFSRSLGSSVPPRAACSARGRKSCTPPRWTSLFSSSRRRASRISACQSRASRISSVGVNASARSRPSEKEVCSASRSRIRSNSSTRSVLASMIASIAIREKVTQIAPELLAPFGVVI